MGQRGPLRAMVVDDSLVIRSLISRMLGTEPAMVQVVASVANGRLAVERARKLDIDVIVLDIEMPVMDGISALPLLLEIDPELVVIMASTLTTRNAEISLRALSAGAKDYVPKPTTATMNSGAAEFQRDLLEKIRALGQRYRRNGHAHKPASGLSVAAANASAPVLRPITPNRPQVLAIGSSTGGPQALSQVLRDLPRPIKMPVFITQHMPPMFTGLLADNLARDSGLPCREAKHGDIVTAGNVYIAPGDYHMTLAREKANVVVKLNQNEKESYCRPAVDPMLRSLVEIYDGKILVGVLTGMGHDGMAGARAVIQAGGNVIAQDEASSVVWGMPGAVAKAGLCCAIVPLKQVGHQLGTLMGR
ncbi:MAG: chemotaxis response regulator protein-glutamate methylesterase [Rhodospirillaceae bacterium]|nr:MAG: chemotaxis response regulator protein-glutamate methylesterase [Rhodospirillaceae bacterium]